MKTRTILCAAFAAMLAVITVRAADITPAQARAIAKEAYIYGFPIVDNYRIQHAYWVDKATPEYKGPWNQIWNSARVYTPADKAIQTPNSDTPYSWLFLDLRAEPMVLTMPVIEKERYFSVQFTDSLHLQLRLPRQPDFGLRWRQLSHRRAGLERRDAQRREEGASLRD